MLELDWDQTAVCLTALVRGGSALPFRQQITAEREYIDGECDCPVGYNCKHVAAALFGWIDTRRNLAAGEQRSNHSLDRWHEKLLRVSASNGGGAEEDVFPGTEMLLYRLHQGKQYNGQPGVNVDIIKTRALKQGGFGREMPYRYQSEYLLPRWMTALDREIINIAIACQDRFNYKPLSLEGDLGIPLLQKLLRSGRCYWEDDRDAPIGPGDPATLQLAWENMGTADGTDGDKFALQATLPEYTEEWFLIPCRQPWYLAPVSAKAGTMETTLTGAMLHELLHAPMLLSLIHI